MHLESKILYIYKLQCKIFKEGNHNLDGEGKAPQNF